MQARFAVCCVRYRALHSVKPGPGPFPAGRVILIPTPRRDRRLRVAWHARWQLGVLAFIVWAVGAALDGASAFAIFSAPLILGAGVCAVLAIDRWVPTSPRVSARSSARRCPLPRRSTSRPSSTAAPTASATCTPYASGATRRRRAPTASPDLSNFAQTQTVCERNPWEQVSSALRFVKGLSLQWALTAHSSL
jgi:hypothetical protein